LRRLLRPGIDFVCKIEKEPPAWVLAVPSAVEQVVLNLVVNAQDALIGKGRITLEVERVALDEAYADNHIQIEPGRYVLVKVSDTGTGISPDHLPHIFEPYYTTKDKGKGTGLGLSTIYGIVQQCQGSVHVYSVPGKGSTFKVYLPEAPPPHGATTRSEPARSPKRKSMRVLLVEDEQSIQRLATRLLERAGHSVACCASAETALNILNDNASQFDLLVSDMVLPGESGLDLACKVPSSLPMILMSGYSEQSLPDKDEVLRRLVFLEKPFSLAQFESKIDEAIRQPLTTQS
ncbi:MAG: response regulator, partial [Candidatus Eremiobacteraeota bacterium]|nr:response regulator [Candidatus Eremiobacteraeota bacterium]